MAVRRAYAVEALKQAVVDLTGIDLDAVVADKGVLVIVED